MRFLTHTFTFACLLATCRAVTVSDSFSSNVDYLTNGIVGTIWHGVYFGAGDFSNTGVGGGAPGETLQCDANITTAGTLTLQTTGTAWEGADDDGFFLFRIVPGDFSAVVHVVSPFDNSGYNTAGLQARAFAAGGDPFNGSENYLSWTRFDEFGFANYLRNEVNGGVEQINPGDNPNSDYWLRMDREGNSFRLYQKAALNDAWQLVAFPAPVSGTVLNRPDLAGQPMQVGIMHATFSGQIGVQFTDFSVTESNVAFATPPTPPTGLAVLTNSNQGLDVSWQAGAGSAGSLVVVWPGTNVLQQSPANGFNYVGNVAYGLGDRLAGAGYYVVYAGASNQVSIDNLAANSAYNVAVFSYAGVGSSIAYNPTPAVGGLLIPPNQIWAQLDRDFGVVNVTFSANPGQWYWLQYSDSLVPANWQNALPNPVLASSAVMRIEGIDAGLAPHRYFRLQEVDSTFATKVDAGGITSLRYSGDIDATEYVSGGKLGSATLKYKPSGGATWYAVDTATLSGVAAVSYQTNTSTDGVQHVSYYVITNGLAAPLVFESVLNFVQDNVQWTLNLTNQGGQPVTVGDLALPFPMNTSYSSPSSSVFKHSFVSGHGSWIFWMRPDSKPPYLTLTTADNTSLEYWDQLSGGGGGGYQAYIHSTVEGGVAAGVGTDWRQANTSLTLPAGGAQNYGFRFQWADGYDGVRQVLVDEGKIDVHVVPGMTVPTNLVAQFALRTTQTINSVVAEFPAETQIQFLGYNGEYQLYQVQFEELGENKLTVNYGSNRKMFLEFFVTEPLEILIEKRAQFLAGKQINNPSKWYDGLYPEWNMDSETLVTPDNYDLIVGFVRYEVASDDAGLSRPAYMAAKNAVLPVQSQVTSLDNYIQKFVWGGLQRTTNETYAYGIYGVQDWYSNRNSPDTGTGGQLHLWRIYDYPHIIVMYEGMYRVAKHSPQITTALTAQEYLLRAYGTAIALFTVPSQLVAWSAYETGLMNELVIADLIDELEAEGLTAEAATLRGHWEQKVNYFVLNSADLFGSEYSFDSTGFEAQQALARYGVEHADSLDPTNTPAYLLEARQFMEQQMAANIFARGWLETHYYHYGSDYRQQAGDWYTLSYMAQMGGWGVMDYGLYYATNPAPYLRLAYGSYLSAWALLNTGDPASSYGFWYPGAGNDGACGGGFEPSPYNTTWLGQPCRRGSWYYGCEEDLGFCGAVRTAATVLADDPIFGRFCYGGDWQQATNVIRVTPKDGVRQRFHAILGTTQLHLRLINDHFTSSDDLALKEDLSELTFSVETEDLAAHSTVLHFSVSIAGTYSLNDTNGLVDTVTLQAGEEVTLRLPMQASVSPQTFQITR